jgi:hypothetical protein
VTERGRAHICAHQKLAKCEIVVNFTDKIVTEFYKNGKFVVLIVLNLVFSLAEPGTSRI